MTKKTNRREFIMKTSKAGAACCGLLFCSKLMYAENLLSIQDDEIDPKKLNYCGYTCPKDCKFKTATLNDDTDLKKEAYKIWKIKEKYKLEFDPKKAICYGCKNLDKPKGFVTDNCTVRECAITKKYDACIECKELAECNKDLWKWFPDFHKKMIELQKAYLESKA